MYPPRFFHWDQDASPLNLDIVFYWLTLRLRWLHKMFLYPPPIKLSPKVVCAFSQILGIVPLIFFCFSHHFCSLKTRYWFSLIVPQDLHPVHYLYFFRCFLTVITSLFTLFLCVKLIFLSSMANVFKEPFTNNRIWDIQLQLYR